MTSKTFPRGIGVLELMIVIAIITFLVVITFSSFFTLNRRETLKGEAFQVLSVISRARSLTLSSKNDTQYGVHLEPTQVVLFSGATYYSWNSTNQVILLSPEVNIATTTLNGGGSDIVFSRLSGVTSSYGTTTISLVASSTQSKTIVVYPTGIAEIR